ncbi:MAG: sugar kinase [Pseudomonadota bacterium]
MASISVFGEPLLELASTEAGIVFGATQLGVAGDTLNTAVYLARLGHDVSFITALGTDTYSDAIVDRLHQEGVATEHVVRHPSRLPGLYAIRTDDDGERYFTYWRDQSAARDFFSLPTAKSAIESALASDLFYFSGISLAILPPEHRDKLLGVARACKARGVRVAFDGNYRPYGWQSPDAARNCLTSVGAIASIVLPTSEDDDTLFGKADPVTHANRWRASGVTTVVVKNGPDGAWLLADTDVPQHVAVEHVVQPIDTTGAGDSFNAGFLAALLDGQAAERAAMAGNRLAGRVIQYRGALISLADMP